MNPFLGLTFSNPALWAGAIAVTAPFLIHLLTRRTPVHLVFPTLTFLKIAKANQSAIYRMRHILLMILRTLLVLAILATFLKPVWRQGALSTGAESEGAVATVVVVDTSASMGIAGGGVTPISRARVAAENILDRLGPSDLANVVFASANPVASLLNLRPNRFQLRADIGKARVKPERANIDSALGVALNQLGEVDGVRREIHFVSDFQRTNWASVEFGVIPEDVKTVFVSVAEKDAANIAVTDVALRPARPAVGEKVRVVCRVANYGEFAREVPVELEVGGERTAAKTISVGAGLTASAVFPLRMKAPGIYEGVVRVPDDSLSVDNTRFFTLPVTDRFRIALLSDGDPTDPPASARILEAALNPFGDERGVLDPVRISPDDFDKFAAAGVHGVLISDVDRFSEKTARALVDYLNEGGGAVYFVTRGLDSDNLALLEEVSDGDFQSPYRVGARAKIGGNDHAALREANYDHPLLKKFRETGALADLQFYRYFETEREKTKGRVLLRFEDENIALAEKSVGMGNLLLANFAPDPAVGNLAQGIVFLPLLHEMVKTIRPGATATRSFSVGDSCSVTVRFASEDALPRFTHPAGEEIGAGMEMNGLEGAVLFGQTDSPGFYRVYSGDEIVGSVPVNVDSRESNPDSLSTDQLRDLASVSKDRFFAETGGDVEALRRLREGVPLWRYFLFAALCFVVLEQAFALAWRR